MTTTTYPWYAIHVKARREEFVRNGLSARGVTSLLPCYTVKRQWSDRQKEALEPLFPGYLFSTFDFNHRLPILQTPGVLEIVMFGGVATPVDPAEIDALCALVESNTPARKHEYVTNGMRVRVTNGPMRGHEGYLVSRKGKGRLVLTVSVLMRAISVEVDEDDVEAVGPSQDRATASASHRHPGERLDLVMR